MAMRAFVYPNNGFFFWTPNRLLTLAYVYIPSDADVENTPQNHRRHSWWWFTAVSLQALCASVRGGFSDKEGGEVEEKEVNVLVLVWRECQESVCKVWVSVEPESKHMEEESVYALY